MAEKNLYTKVFGSGARVYYVDLNKDNKGNPYLTVKEVCGGDKKKKRKRKYSRVFVFPEAIDEFISSLVEARDKLNDIEK